MKKIDEYLHLPYSMELIPDPDEGGYVVSFPDLPGCLSSGETYEEALKNAEDAKKEWLIHDTRQNATASQSGGGFS